MAVAVDMLDLAAAGVAAQQMGRIVIAQDRQGLLVLTLFDIAMRSEISTGGASCDEVLPRQQN